MFSSAILDTAIGVIFIFLLLSLMCSAIAEGIESFMRNRATDLERGIRELITEQKTVGGLVSLARRVFPSLSRQRRGSSPLTSPPLTSPPQEEDYVALLYDHPLLDG